MCMCVCLCGVYMCVFVWCVFLCGVYMCVFVWCVHLYVCVCGVCVCVVCICVCLCGVCVWCVYVCVCVVCVWVCGGGSSNELCMRMKVDALLNFVGFLLSNTSLEYTVFTVRYDITVGMYFLVMGGCLLLNVYTSIVCPWQRKKENGLVIENLREVSLESPCTELNNLQYVQGKSY